MQPIEYPTQDKSTWGEGPWQTEPDMMQFPDPETGLPCLIVRNNGGALCGYVGVPETHKYFGREGDDFDLNVHGGITFADRYEHGFFHVPDPAGDNVWWLGFDCSHYFDLSPAYAATYITLGLHRFSDGTYKDIGYVKAEIASLAKQLVCV